MAKRVQLSRAKGWRMPPNTVKVDRSTRWGNPYKLHTDGYPMSPAVAVAMFRRLLQDQGGFVARVRGQDVHTTVADIRRELTGKDLACWCPAGQECHADVLLQIANEAHNVELTGDPTAQPLGRPAEPKAERG